MRPSVPRPAGPARRNNDAGYGPPGRVTQWDTLGVVQAGASRSDPEGDLLEEEITQYSCGLWDIDQRSTAVSRFIDPKDFDAPTKALDRAVGNRYNSAAQMAVWWVRTTESDPYGLFRRYG